MREQVEERLNTLRDEFKAGQEIQADLESRLASVRHTLVRISGAMQVLEELLNTNADVAAPPPSEVVADAATAAIA